MNIKSSPVPDSSRSETVDLLKARGMTLSADLYHPVNDQDAPLVIAASGGGWRRGHRSNLSQWGNYFAKNGIGFASIDYRRCESGPCFPDNVQDVIDCVLALHDNGRSFGFDPNRVGLIGASAGAHLMASALTSEALRAIPLRAFAGIYGVYDLHRHWRKDLAGSKELSDNLTQNMIGTGPFDNPEIYHQASPARQIRADRALPAFLSWGEKDDAIDPAQSADFALALKQAGFNVRTRVFADAGHFWFSDNDLNQPTSFAAMLAPDLLQFFKRHL